MLLLWYMKIRGRDSACLMENISRTFHGIHKMVRLHFSSCSFCLLLWIKKDKLSNILWNCSRNWFVTLSSLMEISGCRLFMNINFWCLNFASFSLCFVFVVTLLWFSVSQKKKVLSAYIKINPILKGNILVNYTSPKSGINQIYLESTNSSYHNVMSYQNWVEYKLGLKRHFV